MHLCTMCRIFTCTLLYSVCHMFTFTLLYKVYSKFTCCSMCHVLTCMWGVSEGMQ